MFENYNKGERNAANVQLSDDVKAMVMARAKMSDGFEMAFRLLTESKYVTIDEKELDLLHERRISLEDAIDVMMAKVAMAVMIDSEFATI